MQVYRRMDIGTAKPPKDTLSLIPHHMIDVVDPDVDYDVRSFQADAAPIIADALARGQRLVIAGGSGLHFRALVDPMSFAPTDPDIRRELEAMALTELRELLGTIDPQAGAIVDMANRRRLVRAIEIHRLTGQTPTQRHLLPEAIAVRSYEAVIPHLSLGFDAGERAHDRASTRLRAMVSEGLLGEVAALCASMGRTASQAVGYKQLLPVVAGETSLEYGIERAIVATRRLIKHQRTYFRRDRRIRWMAWEDDEEKRIADAVALIDKEAEWTS